MTMKKAVIFIFLSILTICLAAQDPKIDRISYSLSWTPIYYGPNDGEFRLDAILPVNFEANVFYNPNNRISISSGIGFQEVHKSNLSWGYLSIYDPTKSEKWGSKVLRVPIQINYFVTKDNRNLSPYVKAEFVNEFITNWLKQYQDVLLTNSDSYNIYSNTIDIGIGAMIRISNSINLITEGSIGTHLSNSPFDGYQIRLKIGIMIK